jgi:hypothetical protein
MSKDKKETKSLTKDKKTNDENDIKWESVDDKSIITKFLGKTYKSGLWKRISQSKIYKDAIEIHIVNLECDDVNGEDKGYLEYKNGNKLLVYEGIFKDGIPVGTHIQYMPDKDGKISEWICRKHFDKKKTGILLSYDTNIKGNEKTGLKCKNPNPFNDYEKVGIEKNTKTVKELREECKKLKISLKKDDRKEIIENKIKAYQKSQKDESEDENSDKDDE